MGSALWVVVTSLLGIGFLAIIKNERPEETSLMQHVLVLGEAPSNHRTPNLPLVPDGGHVMMLHTLPTVLALGALAAVVNSAFTPATYYDIIEDMLIDPRSGYGAVGIFIQTCDDNLGIVNPGGPGPTNPTNDIVANAPEWIRTLFHDCASYDASTGTGGCDASVQFETTRPENVGSAIRDTIGLLPKPVGISFADVLVVAAVASIKNVTTHTNQFSRMGFTKQEMISLIACGHTVGRVHGVDKPELVKGQPTVPFDHTPFVFDNDVAVSYLNSTTPNALVNGPTAAQRSDFDIFNSDGNATMIG
ncbi:heme peroxidase [Polychytrium aggregatum]|uniref:heme peroxidase n=1 Tax=Polychytrium aggregatum TaxID=110093 RepID=UPI0022FEA76D|nr:heme peroxidase [Polychytrium aggregatum]KAI9204760.1 heme peroxidase [Polychytrium aggregatum]